MDKGTAGREPPASARLERLGESIGRDHEIGAGGIHGLRQEGEDMRVEDMRVRTVPGDDAPGPPARGRVNTAVTVIPLPWQALDRPAVRVRWAP